MNDDARAWQEYLDELATDERLVRTLARTPSGRWTFPGGVARLADASVPAEPGSMGWLLKESGLELTRWQSLARAEAALAQADPGSVLLILHLRVEEDIRWVIDSENEALAKSVLAHTHGGARHVLARVLGDGGQWTLYVLEGWAFGLERGLRQGDPLITRFLDERFADSRRAFLRHRVSQLAGRMRPVRNGLAHSRRGRRRELDYDDVVSDLLGTPSIERFLAARSGHDSPFARLVEERAHKLAD